MPELCLAISILSVCGSNLPYAGDVSFIVSRTRRAGSPFDYAILRGLPRDLTSMPGNGEFLPLKTAASGQMLTVYNCIVSAHDLRLVGLAAIICALASFTAISLLHHVQRSAGHLRLIWL